MLRDVEPVDLGTCFRLRCDPVVMSELGGPQSHERVIAQLARDVETVRQDVAWTKMLIPDDSQRPVGTVTLYRHGGISEIGWMVLPSFQGKGLASAAVRDELQQAQVDGRWGTIHAFPATANAASNAICKSCGFEFLREEETLFAGRLFRTKHWVIDPKQVNEA